MAKVWFSRGDELSAPVCRIDERSEDIPTVGAARPLSKPSEAYRLVFDRPKQPVKQSIADELPHWLEPEPNSAVSWSAKAHMAQAVPRWLPEEQDTMLLIPLGLQQTMPRIPANWRDRLDDEDNEIKPTPLDPEEPPAFVNRDTRQRIWYPSAALVDIAIDSASVKSPKRRGLGKGSPAHPKLQGTGMLTMMLLNVSLIACLLGVVTAAFVAPEAMQRHEVQAVLACLSLDSSCALWSQPLPAGN